MMNPAEFANIAAAERELWWYRGMREILFRMLDPLAKRQFERVLEAGCGTGYFSRVLADRYGWRMTPLDAAADGVAHAREHGFESPVQGDIHVLPFQAESFDAVVSLDVMVHVERGAERSVFGEFARVLRPGGSLILRCAAFEALRSRHSEYVRERQRFTRGRLVRDLSAEGFEIERATYANTFLLPVAFVKFRVWEPLTNQAPASGVQPVAKWLDSLLYLPLRVEAAWIGAGASLPAGQSVIVIARKKSS